MVLARRRLLRRWRIDVARIQSGLTRGSAADHARRLQDGGRPKACTCPIHGQEKRPRLGVRRCGIRWARRGGIRPSTDASLVSPVSSALVSAAQVFSRVTDSALAFVFPGQGSQSLGMLAELAELHPQVRDTFNEASDGAGADLWALSQGGPEEMLGRTEYTQPALLAAGIAVWRLWQEQGGAVPARLAGHSLGEYTALVAAGALSLHDGAHLVRIRGQLMQDAAPAGVGAMAAVLGAEDAMVAQVCEQVSGTKVVVPANYNAPGQIVIGGDAAAVDAAIAELNARGIRKTVKLAVSVPSHTPLMREAANRLAETIKGIAWQLPALPVVQNVDAQVHDSIEAIGQALVRQLYLPVRWTDCVQALIAAGATRIAECGPGKVLTGLAKRIDKSVDSRALSTPADFQGALETWKAA